MTLNIGLPRFIQGSARADLADAVARCLPLSLRRLLARYHRRLIFQIEDGQARAYLVAGLETQVFGGFDPNGDLHLPGMNGGQRHDRPPRIEVHLPSESVLRRRVSFPAQVRVNLHQVLRYELDRISPFKPEDVVFDFMVLPGPRSAERIQVELALCRRDQVEAWIERLAALGAPVERIAWVGAWPEANLLPAERRPQARRFALNAATTLGSIAVLLAVAVLLSPLWQRDQTIQRLDTQLKRLRAQAAEVERTRQELERVRQSSRAVIERKLQQPRLLELLRELTERLPNDTWVQNLEFGPEQIEIRGESGQASALIAILEQSPLIEGVAFGSPVTQIAQTGKERFNISFRYTSGERP
ncbi:pilus assembly protein PilM [Caldichromatium japonicum]|uniref:Pilus assembly protein PilM n=1 Tax=Caldichromatium japonicum TaxID=2699430 RepID=A0A6G7V9L2_9GAMM|nr:PilN domain-containing protein [Caldichromatium japonicum]QIK36674.1 pilus assembly protein PilM [Caldichromatium japonicum]